MPRIGSFALCCAILLLFTTTLGAQKPPTENVLKVQMTMRAAQDLLHQGQPGQAVTVLEGSLNLIGGDRRYLDLLTGAYRSHITDLFLANKQADAQVYLRRLRILDPRLADDLAGKPGASVTTAETPKAEVVPPQPTRPVPAQPTIKARGVAAERFDDPFVKENQFIPAVVPGLAANLLAQADTHFRQGRYAEALTLYQQACRQDPAAVEPCKENWAYCQLIQVREKLKNPNLGSTECQALQQEVRSALALAPRFSTPFQPLLDQLVQRQASTGRPLSEAVVLDVNVQHQARNAQGWQVAETAHFRIFHNQDRDLINQAARAAEQTRTAVLRKWFAGKGENWRNKCDIYLYATATEYTKATGVPGSNSGHSRLESDRRTGVVVLRRMELRGDNSDLLTNVIPHETTHVTLAGQFGAHLVPRWVDEGVAVLSESAASIEMQRRSLSRVQQDLFPVKQLMELDDFPSSRQLTAFFAQSVALVDYLVGLRGPLAFSVFVRDGLQQGYDSALRRHYQITEADLQNRFQQHIQAMVERESSTYAGK